MNMCNSKYLETVEVRELACVAILRIFTDAIITSFRNAIVTKSISLLFNLSLTMMIVNIWISYVDCRAFHSVFLPLFQRPP